MTEPDYFDRCFWCNNILPREPVKYIHYDSGEVAYFCNENCRDRFEQAFIKQACMVIAK